MSPSAGAITYRRGGKTRSREFWRAIVSGSSQMVDSKGRVLSVAGRELKCNGRYIGSAPEVWERDTPSGHLRLSQEAKP